MLSPITIEAAPTPGDLRLAPLFSAARAEELRFLDRLASEYETDMNRFDKPGECLLVALASDAIVAIGGLNIDPYVGEARIGRLRHLYVLPAWRRRGVGRRLVERLLQEGRAHFEEITLRVPGNGCFAVAAAHFYEGLRFRKTDRWPSVTHSFRI